MKILRSLAFVAVLVGSASAWAQVPPIIRTSQPYQSLTGATVLPFVAAEDDEAMAVPIMFPFTLFGTTYSTVFASTNGIVVFTSACNTSGCFTNTGFPSTSIPTSTTSTVGAAVGGVWDDGLMGPNSQIRYIATPSDTTIEWLNLQRRSTAGAEVTFSIKFSAGGLISVHYGSISGSGAWNFSAGIQNANGTIGANLLTTCTSSCTETNFVPNLLVNIGEPNDADLIVSAVTVDTFTRLPDDNLTFNVNASVRNIGRADAGAFEWSAYLSRDRALDATATDGGADILVASGTAPDGLPAVFGGVTADGGQSIVNVTAPAATTVPPPTGEYFVLVLADSTNVVTEATETNNVGSSATAFVQGVDIVATSVSGPTTSVGGADAGVVVNFFNRGTSSPDAGVPFRVLLSNDALLDSTDFPIFNGTRAVSGGQTINETVTFAMPANAPPGEHFYLLQIDPPQAGRPNGVIEEASETNNAAASTGKVTISRSDLVAESVEFLDTVTNLPTLGARFGEPVRMKVRYRNTGQAPALNYRIGLVISNDSSLSLLSDTTVCTEAVASTPVSTTISEITLNCILPLQNRDGTDFTTGLYYFFGQVDVTSAVYETNEQNNAQQVGPVRITAPGADVAVTAVTAPASAGVGEIIPVTRSLRNLGNVNAPEVEYRFYASANDIITTDDVPLSILDGANLRDSGAITLTNGSADTQTELVRLPVTLPAGTYYVGCIIDPARTIGDDLEPGNNALASRTMVVASSSLRVTNTALPDAIIGRPYSYRLSAAGEQGASTWSIDTTQSRPAWLSIGATDGLLTGTPTGANGSEVVGLTVRVENAGRTAVTRLALRVLPTTSALEVSTTTLPAVVNSSSTQYDFTLGAAGGVRPYAWRIASGTLPTGLALNASGTIVGAPRNTPNGTLPITVEVRDAVGGRATRQLSLRLIAPGAITFRTISIPDALIGQEYLQDIAVANQDGSMLAKPLIWRVSGAVPGGLTVTPQAELITVAGRATQAGTFTFAISVEDNNGRTDSLEYTMTVHPSRYRVLASMPEVLRPGEAVTIPLSVSPQGTVTYRSVNGSLPPGLVVEPSGSISGTVSEEGAEGSWSFVIEAKDAAGVSGITPMALRVERLPRAAGCSSTSADWSPLALAFGAALFMFRRRPMRFGVAAALSSLVALVPMAARAQYQVSVTPVVYQPLVNGTPTNTTGSISLGTMVFPFFNGSVGSVMMSQSGYLALDGAPSTVSANADIPHTSTTAPRAFIAPWWDVLTVPANTANGYRYQLTGTAPNRVMAFEWNSVGANLAANRVSFQVLLYETTGRIRFVYSTALPGAVTASVGIMKEAGAGVKGLTCTPSCSSAAYPAGQAIDFFRPPDFEITALSAPQVGYAGVAFPQTAIVRNRGGRDFSGVPVRFYLSTDASLDPMVDTRVGDTTIATLEAQGVAQATLNAPLPGSLTAGSSYFIFAVVDPDLTIAEESDLNNTSVPQAITIGNPTADLVVTAVSAPTTAMPGATLQASRTFQNVGNAASLAAKYSWFLSDNASVSIADRALHVGDLPVLTTGQTDLAMEAVSLPADLAPGSYWLGVCVNYDSATSSFGGSEITIVNNCFTQSAAIQVSTGGVLIATTPLPQATQFAPYGVRLQASGGTGQYTWELANGVLPPGLTLSTAGDLVGSPSTSGSFAFDVKVTSGALTDTRMLSLQVTAGGLPLVIVPQSLTAAEFGRVYSSSLVAVGGRPPYVWRTTGTGLPPGMGVASDGLLEGRALQSGEFSFEVEVKDSAGTVVTNELTLRVVTPTSLSIATAALSSGLVGRDYLQPLVAIGGTAPYAWSLIRFQELPENVTDAPGAVLYDDGRPVAFPAELGLSIDDRDTSDFLSGTPRKAGLYALTFKVKDGLETEDTASVLLRISYRDGLAITTLQLPDAFVGQPYQVRLSHNAGSDAEGIVFSLPCVQQAVRPGEFQCATPEATQQLPAGLMLQPDGVILGTANAEAGVFTFLVKVNDGLGRQDVRAIAIRLRPDFSTASSGCSTAGLPPTTLLALAFGALALRRRRR